MAKSLKPEPRDPKNTLLVDSLNLAFRWKHAGNDYDMPAKFPETVRSLARSYDCGTIILLADGGSNWRRSLHPGYKQTRRQKHENDTPEEKEKSKEFFAYYDEALKSSNLPVLRYPGVEADDLAAFIVENKYKLDINDIWLISSDKDWDLLIEEDVSRFSTVTRKEVTWETWDHPVPPELYIDLKTLMGDKGDDVPGIDGIGPKRAADLIAKYGDVANLIGNLPLKGTAKYIQNLNAGADTMLLANELMDLRTYCTTAIGEHLDAFKQELSAIYGKEI